MLSLSLCSFLASSYNLTCFSLTTFCLGAFTFLSFCIFYFHCFSMAAWWLPGFWPRHILLFFLHSLLFLLSYFSRAYISPPIYSLCQPAPPVPLLPSYWPFSFILDQSGALSRLSETNTTHLYIIKQCRTNKCNNPYIVNNGSRNKCNILSHN